MCFLSLICTNITVQKGILHVRLVDQNIISFPCCQHSSVFVVFASARSNIKFLFINRLSQNSYCKTMSSTQPSYTTARRASKHILSKARRYSFCKDTPPVIGAAKATDDLSPPLATAAKPEPNAEPQEDKVCSFNTTIDY